MGIQTVTTSGSGVALSNAVRARYIADYIEGAMVERFYDQFASPIAKDMSRVAEGSSVVVNFLSDMAPGTTAISEVTDITPQTLVDATATLTPTSRGEGLKASEELMLKEYTGYGGKMFKRIGSNMMESVDILARDAATQGSFVMRNAASRALLDAGATGHRADDAIFLEMSGVLQNMKVPGVKDPKNGSMNWISAMHPHVFHDILQSGNVVSIAQYQSQSILFNHELGSLSGFRLVVSPWAKVFMGAGADNAKVVDTVNANAISPLDLVFTISNTSSVEIGEYLNVGTEETGNTHYASNEQVKYVSDSAKVVTIIGSGANGGFRYAHDAGVSIRNADSVYPIISGGPESLAKVYQPDIGVFGQIVGPRRRGSLDQWIEIGWKWHGGYGRLRENGLLRYEVSVSAEA
jgi:N4-gp56 family major capsid protein